MMTLRDRDRAALDAGMVNVTGKFKGYRFLPHGMKFDKKVKVRLPYDKKLIPESFKEDDVRTYRRNISFQGFALNVNLSLKPFEWINPCGLQGIGITRAFTGNINESGMKAGHKTY